MIKYKEIEEILFKIQNSTNFLKLLFKLDFLLKRIDFNIDELLLNYNFLEFCEDLLTLPNTLPCELSLRVILHICRYSDLPIHFFYSRIQIFLYLIPSPIFLPDRKSVV